VVENIKQYGRCWRIYVIEKLSSYLLVLQKMLLLINLIFSRFRRFFKQNNY